MKNDHSLGHEHDIEYDIAGAQREANEKSFNGWRYEGGKQT